MRRIVLACVLALAGCGDDGETAADAAPPPADAASAADAACVAERVVFLNRGGGNYTKGPDDAAANVSSIIAHATTITAPAIDDTAWGELVTCVRAQFHDFNVRITDEDPAPALHREVAFVGNPNDENGLHVGISSLYALAAFTCADEPTAIALVDPTAAEDSVQLCQITAQTIATTFGLDHELSCPDTTAEQPTCAAFSFVDAPRACGTGVQRTCCDGSATQNSHARLAAAAGAPCP